MHRVDLFLTESVCVRERPLANSFMTINTPPIMYVQIPLLQQNYRRSVVVSSNRSVKALSVRLPVVLYIIPATSASEHRG